MAKKSKFLSKGKFGSPKILLIAGLAVVAGLVAAYAYGASATSDDCVVGSGGSCQTDDVKVVCTNGVCTTTTGDSSDSSDDGDTGGSTPTVRGSLSCTALSATSIRWSASWKNASSAVTLTRSGSTIKRFRGANGPVSSSSTWTETGLSADQGYNARLQHGTTRLDSESCTTDEAENSGDNGDTTGSTSPDVVDGQVIYCHNNICTSYAKGTAAPKAGSSGTTVKSSPPGASVSTTVCNDSDCQTYSSQSDDGATVGQRVKCVEGDCKYEAFEVKPATGVRGFFIKLYIKVNGFFKGLF